MQAETGSSTRRSSFRNWFGNSTPTAPLPGMAVGSTTNDFGTPGAREHAISLDNPQQAVLFHSRLLNACLRANAQQEPLQPQLPKL